MNIFFVEESPDAAAGLEALGGMTMALSYYQLGSDIIVVETCVPGHGPMRVGVGSDQIDGPPPRRGMGRRLRRAQGDRAHRGLMTAGHTASVITTVDLTLCGSECTESMR
jgi:hypothetical protein